MSSKVYHRQGKKANNTGSITYDKARKKYMARFTTPAGNRIAKRFDTEKEANTWIAEQITNAAKGLLVEPSKLTLGDWCYEYLETYSKPKVARRTLETYVQTSYHLEPISTIPLQKINALTLQKFVNSLNVGDNTRLKVYRLLKMILKKAFALGMIARNPMDAVDAPKYEPAEIETFTLEEIKHLLATIKESQYFSHYYTFFHLACATGMRMGELLGLKIGNVFADHIHVDNNVQDLKHNTLQDCVPKTRAGFRDISLAPNIIAELKQIYMSPMVKTEYVFHTKSGKPYAHSNTERTWKHILIEAGLPPRHLHALRHTHATELLASGVPLLEVSKRLGHSKPSVTLDLYGHAIKGYDDKIAQLVSNLF